ncbi:hypothetical protein [Enterobacter asburiae]|jgi:hypothetical protein|uniref:hypothetical protein n=1 Tax=Enterobacter asburiae TaxID=61645 RepID=UPI0015F52423|nr:hypothetical protein [Enterobacter asburiae]MDR2265535.1 hypothetical protein [Enterobacter asburiae]HDW0269925.1 hypothetical protein [Enterobacter asburiae]
MKARLADFKKSIEAEFGITEWHPTESQIFNIATEITQGDLTRGEIYKSIKRNYSGVLYVIVQKGMDFQRMNNLLELASLAVEAVQNEQ